MGTGNSRPPLAYLDFSVSRALEAFLAKAIELEQEGVVVVEEEVGVGVEVLLGGDKSL